MIEILSVINKFLDLKIVQWLLLCSSIALVGIIISFWFRLNTLKLEHAYLKTEAAQLSDGIKLQNNKIKELSDTAKKYQDNYVQSTKKAQEVQVSTAKSLKAISEFNFEGTCQEDVRTALQLVKGK